MSAEMVEKLREVAGLQESNWRRHRAVAQQWSAEAADLIASLSADLARVLEDRARFPDKPDGIGRMIEAHIGNLKLGKEAAEQHACRALDRALTAEAALAKAVEDEREACARLCDRRRKRDAEFEGGRNSYSHFSSLTARDLADAIRARTDSPTGDARDGN